jgi:two-component system sensor histidine kinase KdpD
MSRDLGRLIAALAALGAVTFVYVDGLHVLNATTVALSYLLVVLVVATLARFWIAVATSITAMLAFNYFFLPPVGTLTISDPHNWVALFAFLAVSLVASNLSSMARTRTDEALARRDEMTRLFDVSRDVLLITENEPALSALARAIVRRFDLAYAAICLPQSSGWEIAEGGTFELALDPGELAGALADAQPLEHDVELRAFNTLRTFHSGGRVVTAVPLRLGTKAIGVLAIAGRLPEAGALDALGGVVAIAIERAHFLEELKSADLARQSEELKSALLASLAHDLKTPLTSIRVAASNLQASWLTESDRREQSELVLAEVGRLTRLFDNILEMARIDAGAISATQRWVHPSEIVEAARDLVGQSLLRQRLDVVSDADALVRVDPRLTAAALAHLIENAAQYAPEQSVIDVRTKASSAGLEISVRDRGPGIAPADLGHVFDRFYRGASSKGRASGTGVGLSIARGLLAAEQGRVWADNCTDGGARFTIVVPAEMKPADAAEPTIP